MAKSSGSFRKDVDSPINRGKKGSVSRKRTIAIGVSDAGAKGKKAPNRRKKST